MRNRLRMGQALPKRLTVDAMVDADTIETWLDYIPEGNGEGIRSALADMVRAERECSRYIEAVPSRARDAIAKVNLRLAELRDRIRFLLGQWGVVCYRCQRLHATPTPRHRMCQDCYQDYLAKRGVLNRPPNAEDKYDEMGGEVSDDPHEDSETVCFDCAPCDRADGDCNKCAHTGNRDSKGDRGMDATRDAAAASHNGTGTPVPAPTFLSGEAFRKLMVSSLDQVKIDEQPF